MKYSVLLLLAVILFTSQNFSSIHAATNSKKTSVSSRAVSAQYLKARNVVRAYFGNLKGVSKVTYVLMYQGNGVGQGVMGSFAPGKKTSISRNLYLGTCSGKVCTAHRNIKNIQLEVTIKYTNGKSASKVYKVK